MSGEDQQVQQQTQQSTTEPWAPAQGPLRDLIAKYSAINTGPTSGQTGALQDLKSTVSSLPDFSGQSAGAINDLFSSTTAPQVGMLSSALQQLQTNLGGTASGAELDPYSTPGFSDALSTAMGDITDRVKSVYAGSGRSPSGAGSFAGSLGRGLAEGVAPLISSQFNQNKANQFTANRDLFGGAGSTAQAITGQQQIPLANSAQALGLLPQLMQAFTLPGQTALNVANTEYGLPISNINSILGPLAQIAGLGGQSSGTSTGTVTQPQSTFGNVLGGISTGVGLLSLLSDERAKTDIAEVGELHDGQPVYRYRYKAGGPVHIGLLAQDVAEVEPDAVTDFGNTGLLAVNYGRATERAARMAA